MKTTKEQRAAMRRLADGLGHGMGGDTETAYERDVPALLDDLDEAERNLAAEKCKRLTCDEAGNPDDCGHCEACMRRERDAIARARIEERRLHSDAMDRMREMARAALPIAAKLAIEAATDAGSMVCGDGDDKLNAARAVADDEAKIAEIVRLSGIAADQATPYINTIPGFTSMRPSANLQAPNLVDALPEYQLAPVERAAPARVLAVLTRR